MNLLYIRWAVNPEIFPIGFLSIRYYGLMFAAAFFFGYYIMSKIFTKEKVSIETLDKLTLYVALGTILGARLGHCLFYEPSVYLSNPIRIFLPWRGVPFTDSFEFTGYQGLASHGGVLGILIALYFFTRKYKIDRLWLLDRLGIVGALGGFFIRMGNLFNSEIYGVETNLPWGFIFVLDNQTVPMHPTQLYEALSYLCIFIVLYMYYQKKSGKIQSGILFSYFLISLFTVRFLVEFVKNVQEDFEKDMFLNMGQWLSLPFILVGISLFIYVKRKKQIKTK